MNCVPSFIIAGTGSGCGKTTVSAGIMATLVDRDLKVQPFKIGPDYIDPMFHKFVTGRASRNLDSWMLSQETVAYLFNKNIAKCDVAVIEGVMGLFDGFGGWSDEGSTAHVARILELPIILVVDGSGTSLSVVALIKGFKDFLKGAEISAVILNNINTETHYNLLREVITEHVNVHVLGYLPKMDECKFESRHLGLVYNEETSSLKHKVKVLSSQIAKTVDIDLLLKISNKKKNTPKYEMPFIFSNEMRESDCDVKIAVARDKAFNFYYEDNLDLLKMGGAQVVEFSPINDIELPADIAGIYIGGGYPEVWAYELESNRAMREDLKRKISNGIPTYAECGGLMYMSRSITDMSGKRFDMVGVIRGDSEMTKSLQRFGYVEVESMMDNSLFNKGDKVRAHEFHYSKISSDEDCGLCYKVEKRRKNGENSVWQCGYEEVNLLAAYPHIHFWSNPNLIGNFIRRISLLETPVSTRR